jgi:hypothetical protein
MRNELFRSALADSHVPGALHDGLIRWVEEGILPGSFLRAVIQNQLDLAILRADGINRSRLHEIVSFLLSRKVQDATNGAAFFMPKALTNWPLYIQAENRAAADQSAREAVARVVENLEAGGEDA